MGFQTGTCLRKANHLTIFYNVLLVVLVLQSTGVGATKPPKCDPISPNSDFPKVTVATKPMIPESGNIELIEDENKNDTESKSGSEWKGKRSETEISENHENVPIPLKETRSSFLEVPENGGSNNESPVGPLELVCSASYPVQWNFLRFQLWTPWSVTSNRILVSDETTSSQNGTIKQIFQSILKYPSLRNITQLRNDYPTCHKSENPCLQTSLSVGSDGAKPRLKSMEGSDLILKPNAEFGKNSNCSLRIGYDEDAQVFYCQTTNTSAQVTIFPRSCPNPVECSKVFQGQDESCPLTAPTVAYKDCRPKVGCGKMTYADGYLPSVAICMTRGSNAELANSIAVPFFYSVKIGTNEQPERYLNFLDADPHKMLEMSQFPLPLYAGQEFRIDCNASYYYFGSGLRFEIQALRSSPNDGIINSIQEVLPTLSDIKGRETVIRKGTTGKSGTVVEMGWLRQHSSPNYVIRTPGRYEIVCQAPVWNNTDWISTKSMVRILESTPPAFLNGGNATEILYYKPDRVILCLSTGVPRPNLTWTLNEAPIPSGMNVEIGQNSTQVWTSIKFPTSSQIYGNFTCLSQNYAGSLTKTFSIIPSDRLSATLIIAISVMGMLALILVPAVIFLCVKVRSQKKQLQYLTQEEVDEFLLGKPDYIPFQCDMSMYAYYLPYDVAFEIPRSELEIDFNQVLGSGAYGVVIYGKYENAEVAVKTIKPHSGIDVFKALLSELKIMTYIGKHANIVNLVGACTNNIQKKEVYIALEFCENGSLLAFLRTHRHSYLNPGYVSEREGNDNGEGQGINKPPLTKQPSFLECPQVQYVKMEDLSHIAIINPHEYANMLRIGRLDLFRWAYQIAEGMNYLATKKVIHGDLAARNVLLSRDLTAKIGDFGLSKRLLHYNSYTRTADTPLPIKWMAIETLQQFQFTAESDVWSYGVVLWEIFSLGEIPYPGFNVGEEFLQRLSQGMRLSQPIYCSTDVFDVMMKCWKHDRKQRPKFQILSQYFKRCLETPTHATVGLRLSNLLVCNPTIPTGNNATPTPAFPVGIP